MTRYREADDGFVKHAILFGLVAGYAADGGDGTFIGTDTERDVTVRCPRS
jgi:hypothetical protein